ncbi:MAG TPA: tRNA uridine-5-carboxymethylaminomethyl(34) synthesis GTPase MnmE [Casimicrobiaceae bacterium]
MTTPTIAAIATPPGRGGIGVVRVSGADLGPLVEAIAGRALAPRVATHVRFLDAHGAVIDDGIAIHYPAPHSYTGEDVVECQGHGGAAVMRLLLARCLELGARIAEPGEFTKRAFLNGKLDLVQAESVADLIEASTATAVRAAARSLVGEFSHEVHALRDGLVELRAFVEATLDFPDEDVEFLHQGEVVAKIDALKARLATIVSRAERGAALQSGLTVVLVGPPNVGKSSLLNRLVGEDAAIVTPIPGTTRDAIERPLDIAGIPLTVVDTAGLRETADTVEALGIARTRAAIARADVAVVLADARDAGPSGARDPLEIELPDTLPRIRVRNKCDLAAIAPHLVREDDGTPMIWLCALTGDGVVLLEAELRRIAGVGDTTEDVFLARARQLAALRDAATRVDEARRLAVVAHPAIELLAEELRGAQEALSSITGEFTADDLLGEIFGRFCIGK